MNHWQEAKSSSRPKSGLDGFLLGPQAQWAAFIWGLAEATFFFLVPDVFLTLIAVRSWRPALKGTLAALAGALIGGALMYALGREAPQQARSLLDSVPGISNELIARVEAEIGDGGLVAVLLGPIKGVPYKLYGTEWGARRGDFLAFMLISIPARYTRFLLTAAVARAAAYLFKPWTNGRISIETTCHAVVWIAFYLYYFALFGL